MHRRPPGLFVAISLATLGLVGQTRADGPPSTARDVAHAEMRFHEGEHLFDDKRYAEACAAFDESERLDPQLGTLLNLAFCHETEGRVATAWSDYSKGAAWAEQRGQHERAVWAQARALEVSKRLPMVLLGIPLGSSGDTIEIDGGSIPASEWATPLPLDPGEHLLRVSAAGRHEAQLVVRVSEGSTTNVAVPVLASLPSAPAVERPAGPTPSTFTGTRIVGVVALGIGVGSLEVGTIYGALTLSKKSDASNHCSGYACDATGVALQDDAHRYATVSTVAFAVGLGALGLGTWLTLKSTSPQRGSTSLQPVVGPKIAGLGMAGTF